MGKEIGQLEDRVDRAAERLCQLAEERARLEREVRSLRDRAPRQGAATPARKRSDGGLDPRAIADSLREALAVLRGD